MINISEKNDFFKQCFDKRRQNGYSMAEILLVFGIIAGVLVGVWAIYFMLLGEIESDRLLADVRILQDAAVRYKQANGSSYENVSAVKLIGYVGESLSLSETSAWLVSSRVF